jgi:hypothetical protein
MNMAFVQSRLILAQYMEIPWGDASGSHIGGDLLGAVEGVSQIIHAFH